MGAALADIAALCAPTMALEQVAAIASVQSTVSRLAIRFNSGGVPKLPVNTEEQAVRIATVRLAVGEDLDLGLMGVNGALLKAVGGAFDPCLNLKAAASLLEGYRLAAAKTGVRDADRLALERFVGKGDALLAPPGVAERVGLEVRRLGGKAATLEIKEWVPALTAREIPMEHGGLVTAAAGDGGVVRRKEAVGPPPAWDVFGRARANPGGMFKRGEAK